MLEEGLLYTEGNELVIYRRSRPSTSGLDPEAVHVQNGEPDDPEQATNWLPVPGGSMRFAARFYGPYWSLVDGSYDMSEVDPVEE